MKKIILIFFLLKYFSISNAVEIKCNFEEVYLDGSIQNGNFLIKNDKIRYEYQDERLYTLIGSKDNLFLINNLDRKIFQKIKQNNDTFDLLIDIYNDSPNFKNFYNSLNTSISIEKSNNNFIRRISIKSNNTNLSLYFYNCENINIDDKFFNRVNFFELDD
tara:strand:- start:3129 stop:3611 length:483 start_codon:yes stop_codon:yes gene_type:complete